MPSDETEGLDDADLPGLDDAPAPPAEPDAPSKVAESPGDDTTTTTTTTGDVAKVEWSGAELDDWFEHDFGGDNAFYWYFVNEHGSPVFRTPDGASRVTAEDHPDLHFGITAYRALQKDSYYRPTTLRKGLREGEGQVVDGEAQPWPLLSLEAKTRFRRGWENTQAPVHELAPYPAMETLVDARHDLDASRSALPRWIWIGGGVGVLGLVLAVGFFLLDGDGGQEDSTPVTVAAIAGTAPPSTEVAITDETQAPAATPDTTVASAAVSIVDDTQAPAVAVDNPDPPVVPFPTRWSYTATKTAALVPAPDFITATPIGTAFPWAFDVSETCGEVCTYATVTYPLIPEALLGEVPEATWAVDGAEWSLDVTYQTVQSRNADGTVCVIRNHDVFELTVTDSEIDGRSVPATFTGSWIQATSLDLEASTGDTASYCGEAWEIVDEWSVEGVAAS